MQGATGYTGTDHIDSRAQEIPFATNGVQSLADIRGNRPDLSPQPQNTHVDRPFTGTISVKAASFGQGCAGHDATGAGKKGIQHGIFAS